MFSLRTSAAGGNCAAFSRRRTFARFPTSARRFRPEVAVTRSRFVRLLLIAALFAGAFAFSARPARAQHAYVDQRVSAISKTDLLTRPAAQLVDGPRQSVASALAGYTRPLFFVWAASQIVLLLWLWSSGNAARLRALLARYVRSPIALRFIYGVTIALGAQIAAFPANFAAYRIAVGFGLTGEGPEAWIRQVAVTAFLTAVSFGAIAAFILSLVARTRLWYVYAVGGLFAFALVTSFVAPLAIAPLFDRMRPLAARDPIVLEIRPLEQRAGLASAPVYVDDLTGSHAVASAGVSGFGPTERIVLAQTLVRAATPAEIAFVTAHELGHYVYRDAFRLALWGTFLFVIAVLVAVTLADRIGFRYDDDPLTRLALVGAMLGVVALIAYPAYNLVERRLEAHADRYALAITGDRSAAVRTFVRYADETLSPLCPSAFERIYFDDHPPLGSRIAFALREPDPCPRLLGKR